MKLAALQLAPDGGFRGFGALGLEGESGSAAPSVFNKIISTTIGVMTVVAGVWFIITFITGAIQYLSSGGDKGKIESARTKIVTGVIGITIVVAGIFIAELIGRFIGINLLRGADQILLFVK